MFRYWKDPLFLCGTASYLLNRFLISRLPHAPDFFRYHFNDFWLVPCALPIFLWTYRKLGLRSHDRYPGVFEIVIHLFVWCMFFEWIGPHWLHRGTGDILDIIAYAAGAMFSAIWWFSRNQGPTVTNDQSISRRDA